MPLAFLSYAAGPKADILWYLGCLSGTRLSNQDHNLVVVELCQQKAKVRHGRIKSALKLPFEKIDPSVRTQVVVSAA